MFNCIQKLVLLSLFFCSKRKLYFNTYYAKYNDDDDDNKDVEDHDVDSTDKSWTKWDRDLSI